MTQSTAEQQPALNAADPTAHDPCHVFVLGTGRCGTQTLARMLSKVDGCRIIHEHVPPLLTEVTDFFNGSMTSDEMINLLRLTRAPSLLGGHRVSGESNQRLSFILPQLVEAFPKLKIVWLIRNGLANVASTYHRHWYDPKESRRREQRHHLSFENRITAPMVGEMSDNQWDQLDAFGRCCWYWRYTNQTIGTESARLGVACLFLKVETLADQMGQLMDFLGLDRQEAPQPRTWNAAAHGSPLKFEHWPTHWREMFTDLCGDLMDEHYPAWREDLPATGGGSLTSAVARTRYQAARWWTSTRIRLARKIEPKS